MSMESDDRPVTDAQLEVAQWFANYRGLSIPNRVKKSNNALFGWLVAKLDRIDTDMANEARIDWGLDVDLRDPFSVIGALKYRQVATEPPIEDEILKQLRAGIHPVDVADDLGVTEQQVYVLCKTLEASGFEIDWGCM